MSNTYYILQKDGTYKKVQYTEQSIKGNLALVEEKLPVGADGATGPDGRDGKDGLDGLNGRDGLDGRDGLHGIHGLDGYTPIKGVDYFDGLVGATGPQGPAGLDGKDGQMGLQGEIGPQGPTGPEGPVGPQGPQGIQGLKGDKGDTGLQGLKGDKGDIGPRGFIGPQGVIGPTGATGPRGLKGERGERGFPGPPGPSGTGGGANQYRFITTETHIKPGFQQVAYDMYVIDRLYIDAGNTSYTFGNTTISNDAELTIKRALNVEGTLEVNGILNFEYNPQPSCYGSFYDTTIQVNLGATYANPMYFNTTDISNGITITGGSKIKAQIPGTYNIEFSAQIDKTDAGKDEIEIWLAKNGQMVDWSHTRLELDGNNIEYVASWNWFIDMLPTDYVEIYWFSLDTDMRLLAAGTQSNPDRPAIPSAILTVNTM